MKQWKSVFVFLLLQYGAIFAMFFVNQRAEAAGRAQISNGNIIFETVDTKASTNVRWLTAGFTIRRDLSHGDPLKNGKYAVIHLQPDFQRVEEQPGGTYRITYTRTVGDPRHGRTAYKAPEKRSGHLSFRWKGTRRTFCFPHRQQ